MAFWLPVSSLRHPFIGNHKESNTKFGSVPDLYQPRSSPASPFSGTKVQLVKNGFRHKFELVATNQGKIMLRVQNGVTISKPSRLSLIILAVLTIPITSTGGQTTSSDSKYTILQIKRTCKQEMFDRFAKIGIGPGEPFNAAVDAKTRTAIEQGIARQVAIAKSPSEVPASGAFMNPGICKSYCTQHRNERNNEY